MNSIICNKIFRQDKCKKKIKKSIEAIYAKTVNFEKFYQKFPILLILKFKIKNWMDFFLI